MPAITMLCSLYQTLPAPSLVNIISFFPLSVSFLQGTGQISSSTKLFQFYNSLWFVFLSEPLLKVIIQWNTYLMAIVNLVIPATLFFWDGIRVNHVWCFLMLLSVFVVFSMALSDYWLICSYMQTLVMQVCDFLSLILKFRGFFL